LPTETILTGAYRLGANELSVMRALDEVLSYLEHHHGLDLGKARK